MFLFMSFSFLHSYQMRSDHKSLCQFILGSFSDKIHEYFWSIDNSNSYFTNFSKYTPKEGRGG